MKKTDLIHYLGFEVGIDFLDENTNYGVLTYNEEIQKFCFSNKKNSPEFTAEQVARVWILKS